MSNASRLFIVAQTAAVLGFGGLAGRAEEPAVAEASSRAAPPVELEPLTVYSEAVAVQEPAATFAMPISLLRFEPRVDVQGRGLAEAQADVSIRGGTFENTGFSLGATPLYDPQTGHYFAELPVAPAMLSSPGVKTGTAQAEHGWNATAGGIGYGWRPIRGTAGFVNGSAGDNSLRSGEVYAAFAAPETAGRPRLGADLSVAASQGEGSRSYGDHDFVRYNGRVQLAGEAAQTDLFAGYQSKFFGWPSLYTPPASGLNETENLKTRLYALNHRVTQGADGDYLQLGAAHRRNSDYYDFNRLAPDPVVPFEHETQVDTFALDGRAAVFSAGGDTLALGYRAGVVLDRIDSARLGAGAPTTPAPFGTGRFDDRTQAYAGLYPEYRHELDTVRALRFTAGATGDWSNRHDDAVSPLAEAAFERTEGALESVTLGYARSTQVPTYTALNSRPAGLFAGNRDLDRSTTDNFELDLRTRAAGWNFSTAAFYRVDSDLVDWTYSDAAPNSRTANAVDIDTAGIELGARRSWRAFDLTLGYTWLAKDADYGSEAVDASFYALNFARHRLTAAIVARLGGGFELRMDNEARVQEDNALRQGTDDAVSSALTLGWAVPRVAGLTLEARVDNLWNESFQEVPGVRAAQREWSAGATYAW